MSTQIYKYFYLRGRTAVKKKGDSSKSSHTYLPKTRINLSGFVFSSIYTPSEVNRKSYMLVQIYLHLYKVTKKVSSLAQELC